MTIRLGVAVLALSLQAPLLAQWLHEPTPNIPRLADGKPNLAAPAPRSADGKPDVSGIWLLPLHPGYVANVAADLDRADTKPWAAAVFAERMADVGKDDPGTIGCLPLGPRYITGGGTVGRVKIVQTPGVIILLYEDLAYRQVFMDGRALPRDPFPSFQGYSVGRWEGDELVIESNGFKDSTWLDFGGHPHTEALRVTERYRRTDFGHMQRVVSMQDSEAFAKPLAMSAQMDLEADTELLEAICAETPHDQFHLAGRTASERAVRVAPEVLAKYVGTYDLDAANVFGIRVLDVSLADGQLYMNFNGKGQMPLVPLSDTMFSPRILGTYEFVSDAGGRVTGVKVYAVEGVFTAPRRKN